MSIEPPIATVSSQLGIICIMKIYKYLSIFVLVSFLVLPAFAQNKETPDQEETTETKAADGGSTEEATIPQPRMETFASETNRISYAIGVNTARNLLYAYPSVNFDFFVLGLRDAAADGTIKLSEDVLNASIARYSEEINRLARERYAQLTEKNLGDAEQFLETNGKKEDVVTTPSGLQYRIINAGSGPKAGTDRTATINCTTRLMDGNIIDSTLMNGVKPVHIVVKTAIPAWKEALAEMQLGARWEIFAHPKFAYGEKGEKSKKVGPNELLVFTIEMLGFQ